MLSIVLFLVSSEDSEYGILDFNVFRQAESLAEADYYNCAYTQLDEEHPYRRHVKQSKREDTGAHYGGYAERWEDVLYLCPHGVADKFSRVSGVEPVRYDACNQ